MSILAYIKSQDDIQLISVNGDDAYQSLYFKNNFIGQLKINKKNSQVVVRACNTFNDYQFSNGSTVRKFLITDLAGIKIFISNITSNIQARPNIPLNISYGLDINTDPILMYHNIVHNFIDINDITINPAILSLMYTISDVADNIKTIRYKLGHFICFVQKCNKLKYRIKSASELDALDLKENFLNLNYEHKLQIFVNHNTSRYITTFHYDLFFYNNESYSLNDLLNKFSKFSIITFIKQLNIKKLWTTLHR